MSSNTYNAVNHDPEQYHQENEQEKQQSKFHTFDLDSASQHVAPPPLPNQTTKKRRPIRERVTKLWVWELSCWLWALGFFCAIIAILRHYDGKPAPNWKYGITLATMVSLLSSIATFALVVPLEGGLGQLKWLWFRRARPVSDFETIESAASGPPGSAVLLARGKGGALAWLGATLTILILAIAPFVQQIITIAVEAVPRPGASIPIATSYLNTSATLDAELSMRAAIQRGLLTTGDNSTVYNPPAICPTGNCTYPIAQSLAVCGSCSDLTSQVKNKTQRGDLFYGLPNGLTLPFGIQYVNMQINSTSSGGSGPSSIAFKDRVPLLDTFVMLGHYNWDGSTGGPTSLNMGPYAAECILEFCVQTYNSSSTNGTFTQSVFSDPVPFGIESTGAAGSDGVVEALSSSTTNSSTSSQPFNYTIAALPFDGLQNYLNNLFSTSVSQGNWISTYHSQWPDDITYAIFTALNTSSTHTLNQTFDNIAASMTLNMRTRGAPATSNVEGQAYYQEQIVIIRWAWITLPAAILLLSLLFVGFVAWETRRAGLEVYKNESLATLFAMQGLTTTDMMSQEAKGVYVRLRDDGLGGTKLERVR